MREGIEMCPDGFGDRHLLYAHVTDSRDCSPCECGAATGGVCTFKFRLFSAPACTIEEEAANISAGEPAPCKDLMPGTQLSGKSAEILEYTKGTCPPSGGDVTGDLLLDKPATICCYLPTM